MGFYQTQSGTTTEKQFKESQIGVWVGKGKKRGKDQMNMQYENLMNRK